MRKDMLFFFKLFTEEKLVQIPVQAIEICVLSILYYYLRIVLQFDWLGAEVYKFTLNTYM